MEALRKVTVAAFKTSAKDARKLENGAEIYLGRIVGVAGGLKAYETPNGDMANGLKGQFRVIDADGEVMGEGPVCYLPGSANALVEGALLTGATQVEFAFDIFSKEDAKSATGYVYRTVSVIEPSKESPMEKLASALPPLPSATKALPAPDADNEKVPKKGAKA